MYRYFVAMLVAGGLLAAEAEGLEFRWIGGGSTDWTSSANYQPPQDSAATLPGSGDIVAIPAETTAKLLASDSASLAVVNALARIHPLASTSFLEVNVGTGDADLTLGCPVNAWTGYTSNSRNFGGIIKTGGGTLWLDRTGREYYTTIDIREGTVKLVSKAQTYFLENIVIAEGATLVANPGGYTSTGRLSGAGTITNTVPQVFQLDEKDMSSVFDGVVASGVYFYAGGNLRMNGTSNSMNNFTVRNNGRKGAEGPVAELKSFGRIGQKSSAGGYQNIFMAAGGGYLRYGGTGETTDKMLYVNGSSDDLYFLDGGETGGLNLAGGITFSSYDSYTFEFTGGHTVPCVFSGAMICMEGSGDVPTRIIKSGTGTWRFADNVYRLNTEVIKVSEGTLQFDSIAENGKKCSLGPGTGFSVLFPFILGGDNGSRGMMEYTGSASACCTTRMVGLSSEGGFRSNTASLRISGVMDLSDVNEGPKTLVLDGAAGSANDIQNIRESSAAISIVKEGAGTWYVSGDAELHGRVEVKAGTLVARDPKLYRWYRFNIKKLHNKNSNGDSSADGNFMLWMFGLYDADGNWITAAYPQQGDNYALGAGSAGFASGTFEGKWEYSSDTYGSLANAFVDSMANSSRCCGRFRDANNAVMEPDPNDESTWGRIVIRVADDAPPVVSYDFVQGGFYHWACNCNIDTWSLDASVDGITWEEVSATEEARGLWQSSGNGSYYAFWYYGRELWESGQASSHTTGKAIAAYSVSTELPTALASVTSVSVADGAVFRSQGAGRTIGTLKVDAAGAGRIDGFAFGEEGTLEVVNAGPITAPRTLPGEYANVSGLANLAGWNLRVDGVANESVAIRVDTTGASPVIRLVPPPFTLIVR